MAMPDLERRLLPPEGVQPERYEYFAREGHEHHMFTGPAIGWVKLADGTLYDVTRDFIAVETADHVTEVNHHIGLQHEATHRFDQFIPETGERIVWQHTDCPHCDAPKTLHFKTAAERTAAARKEA